MDLGQIEQKLPLAVAWIDKTLETHAGQAQSVATYGFSRLPLFFSADLLNRAMVVEVARIPMLPLAEMGLSEFAHFQNGDYSGITYKGTYFLKEDAVSRESLHFHELIHIIQWQHLGVKQFLLYYAAGLLRCGYTDSPMERMAYTLQKQFEEGCKPFDIEALVCSGLDDLVNFR